MEDILKVAKNAAPPTEGSEVIEGVKEEVEILWDKWGIPHIYAKSIDDAFFSQGYIHARHRLWQMETFRRLTTGELSEISGDITLDLDKHYRIIGLHRIAKKNADNMLKNSNSDLYRLLKSYVKGVNAGIEKARENPPIEFHVLDFKPKDWTIEDSLKDIILIEWGLSSWAFPLELLREHLIIKLGVEMADKVFPLYSGVNLEKGIGSNAWAVNPERSESGAVMLANDPHLPLLVPSIWFLVHLNCPELNVMGTSFAGLPGVVIGHNEKIAWGLTSVSADTTDLFKLEINPDNENQYKYNGQWIDFDIIKEPIKVREKAEPLQFKVFLSKFGPVMKFFEMENNMHKINLPGKYALRWSSFGANVVDILGGFNKINRASNWNEFREAIKITTINPQNFIYGDINGNIGHQHGGKIPSRKYGDGAMITPGTDQKFNWDGFVPFEKMFSVYNPKQGFVYTANYNEDKAPNGALIAQDSIGFYRQMRIKKLLQSKEKFTVQDFKNFQNDYYSEEAAVLLPLMLEKVKKKIKSSNKLKPEILSLLENWDYILTSKSVAGAIYKIWQLETTKEILYPLVGKEIIEPYIASYQLELDRLFKLFDDNKEELEDILLRALEKTIDFLSEKISLNHNKWEWGKIHKIDIVHPFSLVSDDARILNIGPFKAGGDGNTLNNGYFDPLNDFSVYIAPAYRQIYDLSDWDKSIAIIPGGQSGLPFHKHYKDLMKLYLRGKYIPFLFTKEEISKNLEGIVKLIPK